MQNCILKILINKAEVVTGNADCDEAMGMGKFQKATSVRDKNTAGNIRK